MNNLNSTLQTLSGGLSIVLRIGSVILSLMLCLTGYRMVRKWVAFIAFVVGAALGYAVASSLELGKTYWYLPLLIGLAAGVLLSLAGFKLFQLGLFVFCGAVASWAVTSQILPGLMGDTGRGLPLYVTIALQIIIFVVGGVLAVRFSRSAIICISAIGGARLTASGLAELLPAYFPDASRQLMVFAGLAVLGILLQFLTTRRDA